MRLVLIAVAYVQWRQYQLLDAASHFQNDALGWSFSQLETEQLRLRNQVQSSLHAPEPDRNAVQLRYDIFISRIGLVDSLWLWSVAAINLTDLSSRSPRHWQAAVFAIAALAAIIFIRPRKFGVLALITVLFGPQIVTQTRELVKHNPRILVLIAVGVLLLGYLLFRLLRKPAKELKQEIQHETASHHS